MREFLNAKTVVVAGPSTRATQASLFEKPEANNGKPSEFHQIAEQLRKFEPRKNPLVAQAEQEEKEPMRGSVLGL